MHIYKQILLYILNENIIWPSGAIARDIVSQEKNTMCILENIPPENHALILFCHFGIPSK